jgi:putative transposon-encoded protein
MSKRKITIEGYEMVEKTAGKSGNSGYLYLPAKWIGKKVVAVLLEPIEEE